MARELVVMDGGRLCWPAIVQYRIVEGPDAGTFLNWPPTPQTHPLPRELFQKLQQSYVMASCAYVIVVHNQAIYDQLSARGWMADRRHTGRQQGRRSQDKVRTR